MRPAISETQVRVAAAVPVVLAVLVYLPALRNGFIWDDPLVLQQLRAIRSAGDLFVLPPAIPRFYFRPLIFASLLFDQSIAGDVPYWFHVSVIMWHALSTLLVFLFAQRLFPGEWLIASGGALLFAVFPGHVESVAWIAGRSDVMACALLLLSVLLAMERERAWSAWVAGAVLLLALFAKELAVAGLLLVPLLDLMSTHRLYWLRYVPLTIAALAYFVLRNIAVGAVVGGMPTDAPAAQMAAELVCAVGFYATRALVPVGLCGYMPDVPTGIGYLLIGASVAVGTIAGIAWTWRRGAWAPGFLAAWFLVTLAPSLTVIVRRSASAVIADRYLYVPSVASCLLVAWALTRLAQSRRLAPQWPALAIGAVSLVWAMLAVPYTRVWADNVSFWGDVATKVPADALPHRELGTALLERGRLDEAERAFQQALAGRATREGRAMTYGNLGNVYRRKGRFDDALHAFDAGLKIGPHPILFHNVGMTLMAKVQNEQREVIRRVCCATSPKPARRSSTPCASAMRRTRRPHFARNGTPRRPTRCSARCCSPWATEPAPGSSSKPRCACSRPAPWPT